MNLTKVLRLLGSAAFVVFLFTAFVSAGFGAGPASAAGGVSATATIDGRALAGATAANPVRLDPGKVTPIVMEVKNDTGTPISVRRIDFTGHVLGLNFFSYSTSVEMTIAAGKTEKLTYRLDPAGLDGQATGLIGSDLTLIGSDGNPVTGVHTVIDVRGSLFSVYGLFGVILAVLTCLAIADAALSVARHRLSANRWQRGVRLLAPGLGLGLMTGFTASVARWWVPGTGLWLALAGIAATVFFLVGYLSPTPRRPDDLGLDAEDLAAARELDSGSFQTVGAHPMRPGGTLTFPDPAHPPTAQDLEPATTAFATTALGTPDAPTVHHRAPGHGPVFPTDPAGLDEPTIRHEPLGAPGASSPELPTVKWGSGSYPQVPGGPTTGSQRTVPGGPATGGQPTVSGGSDAVRGRGPVRGVAGGPGVGETTIGRDSGRTEPGGRGPGSAGAKEGGGSESGEAGRVVPPQTSLPTVRWVPGPPGSETDPEEPTIRDGEVGRRPRRGGVGG